MTVDTQPLGPLAALAAELAGNLAGSDAVVLRSAGTTASARSRNLVVRVASPQREAVWDGDGCVALSRAMADAGVPTPAGTAAYTHHDLSVTHWPYVDGTPDDPFARPAWEYGTLVAAVHRTTWTLDPSLPRPGLEVASRMDVARLRTACDSATLPDRYRRIAAHLLERNGTLDARVAAATDELVWCHSDLNPGNIVGPFGAGQIVDWELAVVAPRWWDFADMALADTLGWEFIADLGEALDAYRDTAGVDVHIPVVAAELRARLVVSVVLTSLAASPEFDTSWCGHLWEWVEQLP